MRAPSEPSEDDAAAADDIGAAEPDRADAATKVLVVEDDPMLAWELGQALEEAGLRVIGPCLTYRDALAAIAREPPHCVVMDIDLGRGDLKPGFEGERVLAILSNAGCRCVIFSGHVELFRTIAGYYPRATLIAKPAPLRRVVEALVAPDG